MQNNQDILVALPGVDAQTAPDYMLLFSSRWPTIKLFKNITINQTFSLANYNSTIGALPIYTHGLGFVPAIVPYGNGANSANNGIFGTGTNVAEISNQNITFDKQNIYYNFTPNIGQTTVSVFVQLFIIYTDIEQAFTAPVIQTGPSSVATPSPSIGIFATKEGFDVSNSDLRHFTISSFARSPMIHDVVPGTMPGLITQLTASTYTYTHDLSYTPMFFVFAAQNSIASGYFPYALNGIGVSSVNNTITLTGGATTKYSILILQDPFLITDNVINVSL